MRGEQAIFNLEIKKKSGLRINPDIHHSKVFSSVLINYVNCDFWKLSVKCQTRNIEELNCIRFHKVEKTDIR